MQRAFLHQHGRHRATATVKAAFNHRALGRTVRVGAQFQHFRLQQNGFLKLVQPKLLQRRDFHILGLAAHFFHHHVVLQQLLAHAVRVRAMAVDLVDRHDNRHIRRFRVFDRLDRLRHHAVIGGHHQHHNVGHPGAAGTHGGKRLMARRVEEGDLRTRRQFNGIGADMLGNAASLTRRDVSMAQRIEQTGFAMVDMAHDGHNRRTRQQRGVGIFLAFQAHFHVGIGNPAGLVAKLGDHQLGGVGVNHLRDVRHHAHLHQGTHHLVAARGHTVGQFLHGDRVRQNHFAHHFHAIGAQQFQLGLAALTLTLAAHGSERTHLLVLTLKRCLHVDLAGTAAVVANFLRRHHGHAALGRGANARALHAARGFIFLIGAHAWAAAWFQLQRLAARHGGSRGSRAGRRRASHGRSGGPGCRSLTGSGLNLGGLGLGFRLNRGGLGFTQGFFLAAASFLGCGEDGNLLLLAALGLTQGGNTLLFGQHALAGRQLGGGKRARRGARAGPGRLRGGSRNRGCRGRRRACHRPLGQRLIQCQCRHGCRRGSRGGRRPQATLLAHLNLYHFRPAMREALPHRSGVDRMPRITARSRAQREPAFGFSLVVAVSHA